MTKCDVLNSFYVGREGNKLFTKLSATRILVIITYLNILKDCQKFAEINMNPLTTNSVIIQKHLIDFLCKPIGWFLLGGKIGR